MLLPEYVQGAGLEYSNLEYMNSFQCLYSWLLHNSMDNKSHIYPFICLEFDNDIKALYLWAFANDL